MQKAQVIGTVVLCTSYKTLKGKTFKLIKDLYNNNVLVALDLVGSREDDNIIYVDKRDACHMFMPQKVPTDATIIGIIDN